MSRFTKMLIVFGTLAVLMIASEIVRARWFIVAINPAQVRFDQTNSITLTIVSSETTMTLDINDPNEIVQTTVVRLRKNAL